MIKFKGKLPGSTTFNLTETARNVLKALSVKHKLSAGDVIENLIRKMSDEKTITIPVLKSAVRTGPKGGAPSLFPGKNRGTTTAVTFTALGRALLDSQVEIANVSRGDLIELLLRLAGDVDLENDKLDQLLGINQTVMIDG